MKRDTVSLKIGSMKGLSPKKAPKLLGGKKAPKKITDALGIHQSTNVSPMMLSKLLTHPDASVSAMAKRLMGK